MLLALKSPSWATPELPTFRPSQALPIGPIVVPFWEYLIGFYMGGCQNYGPFLGRKYNTAPII